MNHRYDLKLTDTRHTAIYACSESTGPRVGDFIAESVTNIILQLLLHSVQRSRHLRRMSGIDNYEVDSMVRGYHVYRNIWEAAVGQTLPCQREASNAHDLYAVSVTERNTIVGHLPRSISAVCSLFLRRNGTISCEVTGTRHKSSNLPQGGLEIPCKLIFAGAAREICKVQKLLQLAQSSGLKVMCEQDKEEDTEAKEKLKKADVVCKQDGIIKEPENRK